MATDSHRLITLSNGLRLLHVPAPENPAVFVAITGRVGRRAEEDDEIGAAHFLEHLFFDGTIKRPSAFEVSRFVDDLGGIRNGTTGQERVSYYIKVLSEHSKEAFDFISDILMNSALTEIAKERKVIAQEAAAKRDDPTATLGRRMYTTLYPGQRIGRTIFDEDVNLENINDKVLRNYMERNYVTGNFILTVAGNITIERATELGEEYFGGLRKGKPVKFDQAVLAKDKIVQIDKRDFTQSKMAMSFEAFPLNHKDAEVARVMSMILGGGSSSRLNNRLRNDLHLVYAIMSGLDAFSDTGYFTIQTFVNEENLQRAVDEIIKEINKLVEDGCTEEELAKGKNMILSRLLFSADNIQFVGNNYASQQLLSGQIRTIEEQSEAIRAVTTEDILRVARLIFSDEPKVNVLTKSIDNLNIPPILTAS
jgi:predicted Zn-dependent peptidase